MRQYLPNEENDRQARENRNEVKRLQYPKSIAGESRWVDYDEETALWCVFGTESGHAYSSHASEESAKQSLQEFEEHRIENIQ